MSDLIRRHVWESAPVDGTALLVLLWLAEAADDRGMVPAKQSSLAVIADAVRRSPRAVQYAIVACRGVAWLAYWPGTGPNHVTVYQVVPMAFHEEPTDATSCTSCKDDR